MPAELMTEVKNSEATSDDGDVEEKESVSEEQPERIQKDEEQMSSENLTKKEPSPACPACLTIQPNRLLCGVRLRKKFIQIWLKHLPHYLFCSVTRFIVKIRQRQCCATVLGMYANVL